MGLEIKQTILDKIDYFEKNQLWDNEVFENPETKTLRPEDVDYLSKKWSSKMLNKIANRKARKYFDGEIKKQNFVIKDIKGIENYLSITGGMLITCNHCSIYDHYVVYKTLQPYLKSEKRNLYKIIREGNYTSFKGLFGTFFRHCNTLPLSSNQDTMKKFLRSLKVLLERGEKVLIYPEQALWKNYRKPRPCKTGAFNLAVKNNVPILPIFLTMEEANRYDADGFACQIYTVNILPPIYLNPELSSKENIANMQEKNYHLWKQTYESFYGVKLEYLTEK